MNNLTVKSNLRIAYNNLNTTFLGGGQKRSGYVQSEVVRWYVPADVLIKKW